MIYNELNDFFLTEVPSEKWREWGGGNKKTKRVKIGQSIMHLE